MPSSLARPVGPHPATPRGPQLVGQIKLLPMSLSLLGLMATTMVTVLAGCGAEDVDGDKVAVDAPRSAQHAITSAQWQALLGQDANLKGLVDKVGMPWQAAGVVEVDDGRKLTWAEYAPSAAAAREAVVAVFQQCAEDGSCTVGQGNHTAQSVRLVGGDGAKLSSVRMGSAVLHKQLKNHNLSEGRTVLRLGLSRKHIIDPKLVNFQADAIPQGARRLVIVSAYGAAVDLPLTKLRAAAEGAGIFDEVKLIEFARRRDLQALLPTMTAQDVLIWVGAGVLEPFTDKPAKSVGMTLSRGIFGDELIHRDHLKGLLDAPALGGPGLVLLAGSNSLTAAHTSQTGLLAQALHLAPYRPVVGFDGTVTPQTAEAGAVALLNALAKGESLSTAISAASKAAKAPLTTLLPDDQAKTWRLPVAKDKFWASAPKSAQLKLLVKNTPKCVAIGANEACTEQGFKAATQAGKAVPSDQLTAAHATFSCDVTFDGPWFSCTSDDQATGAKFSLRGVMTGHDKGDALLLMASGAPNVKMKDATFVGVGVIEARTEAKGTLTIKFGGDAAGSTWRDGAGNCCIAVTPLLIGNQSQRSSLTITL